MEYRAYFFGNMYLSSIQQGIQAAHALAEIYCKHPEEDYVTDEVGEQLHIWARYHKTMVLLNGGDSESLDRLVRCFRSKHNSFPWAPFYESEGALNKALTSVGIIIPEYVYIGAKQMRMGWVEPGTIEHRGEVRYADWDDPSKDKKFKVSKWEFQLMGELNNYGLAK